MNGSSDFMFGKETSHELSCGKQLSPKVGRFIHKFLKKICSFFFVFKKMFGTHLSSRAVTSKVFSAA